MSHAHEPLLLKRQVLTNDWPAASAVPSGIETSETNAASFRQALAAVVAVAVTVAAAVGIAVAGWDVGACAIAGPTVIEISAGSLADVWRRHVWDCAQLVRYIPLEAKTLADMGAGAGFPGLVLAELLRGRVAVTLFEATAKKARFLEAAVGQLHLPSLAARNL